MKTVLILGANGRFGQAATQAFAAAGWRVRAQMRRAPVRPLPAQASALLTPLADTAALCEQAAGAQAVVHAINPIYTRWDAEVMPALKLGLDAAQQLGALFMLPGNVYNFGESMPAVLTEQTAQQPSTTKGRQRCAMENLLRDRASSGLRSVVIRAGDFYGCGSGSWLDLALAKNLKRGRLVYPGPLDLHHAWAYLPDLAQAFAAVAAAPSPSRAFDLLHFAGHAPSGAEFVQALQAAANGLGLRPVKGFRVGAMPWGLIRAGGLVLPMWRELARMSYLWRVPHQLDGTRLAARVQLPPATPLQAALRQSLLDLGLAPDQPLAAPAHPA